MSPLFEARDIQLGYPGFSPLSPHPQSFLLPESKTIAVLGPNGSGKSTLMSSLFGGTGVLSGGLWFSPAQKEVGRLSAKEISRWFAYVNQDQSSPPDLLVVDILRLAFLPRAGYFGKLPSRESPEILAMLNQLGLEPLANRPLRMVSVGERQKTLLGRALLQRPTVLLLDEPTNHLDPGGVVRFWKTLSKARETKSFHSILSTHDLAFAQKNCDWILALKAGEVFYNGPPTDFWTPHNLRTLFNEEVSLNFSGI